MRYHSCCNHQKVKRGLWSPEEDEKLITCITTSGYECWSEVPQKAGLERCGKSCRLRWINYLRPDIIRGRFTPEEESLIITIHALVGNRWAHIASHLPGRTDNEIKNYWNSWIRKKIPKSDHPSQLPSPNTINLSNLNQDSVINCTTRMHDSQMHGTDSFSVTNNLNVVQSDNFETANDEFWSHFDQLAQQHHPISSPLASGMVDDSTNLPPLIENMVDLSMEMSPENITMEGSSMHWLDHPSRLLWNSSEIVDKDIEPPNLTNSGAMVSPSGVLDELI